MIEIDDEFEPIYLIEPSRCGLLVVDMQEKLWPCIHEKEVVLTRVRQAIRVAGHLGIPIMVTEQYRKGLGATLPDIRRELEKAGGLSPIEKVSFSCFGEESFEKLVNQYRLQTLVIVGIEAHICVMQTALEALDRDMELYLLAEATGSRDPSHKAEAVTRMRDAGAIVGSVEMFAFEFMRTAKHDAFREVQKVII